MENFVAIMQCLCDRSDGWVQVGHNNGPFEAFSRVRDDSPEELSGSDVYMPVVGCGDCYFIHKTMSCYIDDCRMLEVIIFSYCIVSLANFCESI